MGPSGLRRPVSSRRPSDRVDLGVRYGFTVERAGLTASINIQNAVDIYFCIVPSGGGAVNLGKPRTVRFSVSANF